MASRNTYAGSTWARGKVMSPALEGRPIVDKSTMHFGVAHINETFASMTAAGMMSADDVAQVIYNHDRRHGSASLFN
ncbi:hypothetical protein SAMD00079811_76070 (plasmid) [Scytonema sp. HK-05]|uniref:hypothetical protein n=1 Tax=Scytonema sp. HK-05 TaxID=1137095 RepID=UPI00093700A4|nr:hypothetical protein [Scytonema sp. HK-05]BAY49978.1 hypothetical protein SAMD00079811_76070 [Scytonema sp. HK-05]